MVESGDNPQEQSETYLSTKSERLKGITLTPQSFQLTDW